jgi:NAD(P)-dependent dehydrogenase (short-subunit alcohol dehydrogenase family)
MRPTTFAGKSVLVTDANCGLGQALVDEALSRSAQRVYAGTRQPLTCADEPVMPLVLDVTDAAQGQSAFDKVDTLDILRNNAGVPVPDDLNDRSAFERLSGNHPRFGAASGSPPDSDWVSAASA